MKKWDYDKRAAYAKAYRENMNKKDLFGGTKAHKAGKKAAKKGKK